MVDKVGSLITRVCMEIMDKKSTKNLVVDHLSRLESDAVMEEGEMKQVFPNEQLLGVQA